jgi:hypothetical protein
MHMLDINKKRRPFDQVAFLCGDVVRCWQESRLGDGTTWSEEEPSSVRVFGLHNYNLSFLPWQTKDPIQLTGSCRFSFLCRCITQTALLVFHLRRNPACPWSALGVQ